MQTIEFFSFAKSSEKYVHLSMINAMSYTSSLMEVDDRLSNIQVYRIVQIGNSEEGNLLIQVIRLDLVGGIVDEAQSNLTDLKQECADQIKMQGNLIVILCQQDHTLSFMLITEQETLKLISKRRVFDGDQSSVVSYSDIILIRHAKNAYQIYLQGESEQFGRFTQVFEVYTEPDKIRVF